MHALPILALSLCVWCAAVTIPAPDGHTQAVPPPAEAALHCSLAVLATPSQQQATTASSSNNSSSRPFQALFSSGKGDLVLVTRSSSDGEPGE